MYLRWRIRFIGLHRAEAELHTVQQQTDCDTRVAISFHHVWDLGSIPPK